MQNFRMLDDANCVLYIGFDRYKAEYLLDDSLYDNKVTLQDGAMISKKDGSCGVCAQLLGGKIAIDGKTFIGITYYIWHLKMSTKMKIVKN